MSLDNLNLEFKTGNWLSSKFKQLANISKQTLSQEGWLSTCQLLGVINYMKGQMGNIGQTNQILLAWTADGKVGRICRLISTSDLNLNVWDH